MGTKKGKTKQAIPKVPKKGTTPMPQSYKDFKHGKIKNTKIDA